MLPNNVVPTITTNDPITKHLEYAYTSYDIRHMRYVIWDTSWYASYGIRHEIRHMIYVIWNTSYEIWNTSYDIRHGIRHMIYVIWYTSYGIRHEIRHKPEGLFWIRMSCREVTKEKKKYNSSFSESKIGLDKGQYTSKVTSNRIALKDILKDDLFV